MREKKPISAISGLRRGPEVARRRCAGDSRMVTQGEREGWNEAPDHGGTTGGFASAAAPENRTLRT